MIALIQRVKKASVEVEGKTVGKINNGMLVFVGIEKNDNLKTSKELLNKILKFRIFADENDKMNLNIEQSKGEILLVPQFTLAANTKKGNRPSFDSVADPTISKQLFNELVVMFKETNINIQTGIFQADMQVSLINDGPVTFWIEK